MALTMQPKKTREGVLGRFLMALSDDDRAEALGYLHDRNYGPGELARAFAADGYEGTEKPIYAFRLKEGI